MPGSVGGPGSFEAGGLKQEFLSSLGGRRGSLRGSGTWFGWVVLLPRRDQGQEACFLAEEPQEGGGRAPLFPTLT